MFKPRLTKPEAGNKYYIRKAEGGYSDAVKGSPTDKDCNVLSNCVGFAVGRFNEIGNYGSCKYLWAVNAENFNWPVEEQGLKTGQEPKLGACMVWQKGATQNASDGAGHVAIVEQINADGSIVTSESAWNGKAFYTVTRTKGANGRWGMGEGYTFLNFIYNPAVSDEDNINNGTQNEPQNGSNKEITMYRVKKSWKDDKSQIGAFTAFKNAKETADKNAGYNVYDNEGSLVYPITSPADEKQIKDAKAAADKAIAEEKNYEKMYSAFYSGYLKLFNMNEQANKDIAVIQTELENAVAGMKDALSAVKQVVSDVNKMQKDIKYV